MEQLAYIEYDIAISRENYNKILYKLAELEEIRRAQANEVQQLIDSLIDAETEEDD